MSYDELERSREDGDPLFRFLFVRAGVEYAYTTEPFMVSDSVRTYEPAPISSGQLSQTNDISKDPLSLDFPRTHSFAMQYQGGVPEDITSVTVFRLHASDPDVQEAVYWRGRIAGASSLGDVVRIDCENIFTSMQRPGLRARYQKRCRHALYQRGCNLLSSEHAFPAAATAADGFTVTVPDLASSVLGSNETDADYFVGGVLELADGSRRLITGQEGESLTLIRPLDSLTEALAGSGGAVSVTLYPGCDHTAQTCLAKFDNLNNYGGFPYIPDRSPFNTGITGSIS